MNLATNVDRTMKNKRFRHHWYISIKEWFIASSMVYFIIGLLLGRAVILYNISPFAIAFLATVWTAYERRLSLTILFIWIGAWTFSTEHAVFIMLSTVIF